MEIYLYAFLGGLLLNLMPCVLPVIMIKLYQFISNPSAKAGVYYLAGTTVGFTIVGAISWYLLQGSIWGMQMSNPLVNLVFALLYLCLGLHTLGVLLPKESTILLTLKDRILGRWGNSCESLLTSSSSFLTGLLSPLVASSCLAPLMGIAIFTALGSSLGNALLLFTIMGIGLGVPFLLGSFIPYIQTLMTKLAKYMKMIKIITALALFATAGYFGYQTKVMYDYHHARASMTLEEQILDEANRGTNVLVYFTASWCPSCQVFGPRLKSAIKASGFDIKVYWIDLSYSPPKEHVDLLYGLGRSSGIPTLLLLKGDKIERLTGAVPESYVLTLMNKIFGHD